MRDGKKLFNLFARTFEKILYKTYIAQVDRVKLNYQFQAINFRDKSNKSVGLQVKVKYLLSQDRIELVTS